MKRVGRMGLCLFALLAMGVTATATASAEAPEFGKCVAKAGGKFLDAGCTKASSPGKEKYEWEPLAKGVKFNGKMNAGTLATLETVKGTKITCKAEEGPGEIANPKEVGGVVAKFNECETGGIKCNSAGGGVGEIVTTPLSGVLGVEKLGATPVANKLAVELHGPGGGPLAEFSCSGIPVVVTGSVLHPVVSNKMLITTTEKFTAAKGEQKPDKFVGGPVDQHILESATAGGAPEEAGQTITATVTAVEKVEASSVN